MKLAIFLVALLPFAMGAHIQERFVESLLGGYDIIALAGRMLVGNVCLGPEVPCETTLCPRIIDQINGHNALVTGLVCRAVCKEAQVLAKQYGTGSSSVRIDLCIQNNGELTGQSLDFTRMI